MPREKRKTMDGPPPHPRWKQIAELLGRPELATANRAYRRANTRKRRGHKLAAA